jgi:hypothetical protein
MTTLRPHLRTWLIMAAIVAAVVLVFRGLRGLRSGDPHAALRDTITELRMQADSCQIDVDSSAAELRAYDRRLDSMRERVREMEALDERGVPADSYAIYMTAFTAYNDSAAAWPPLEQAVRDLDADCRAVAEHHNILTDSLRRLVLPGESPE